MLQTPIRTRRNIDSTGPISFGLQVKLRDRSQYTPTGVILLHVTTPLDSRIGQLFKAPSGEAKMEVVIWFEVVNSAPNPISGSPSQKSYPSNTFQDPHRSRIFQR